MILTPQNYADFLLIANNSGTTPIVYYHDGGGSFQISAIAGNFGIRLALGSAKPGSFNTDFPAAVALSSDAAFQ